MAILLLFFCSGATALVYEVIWSKYLSLLFGSTVQAQTVVLAIFMGGLALGNRLFGRRADRSAHPLAIYGYLEVGIGLYAFAFPYLYRGAEAAFAVLGGPLLHQTTWLLLLKGLLSAALLLGPTVAMGGTLPVLAAWLQRNTAEAGRRSARFYSTNSLGAVFGAGMAGFVLITALGLTSTLQMTALVNVLIGFAAIGISRRLQNTETTAETPAASTESTGATGPSPAILRWGCVLVALTGAVSMGLEVLASRCLALIFGGSLQAFAIVLMAFILGIGLGSAVIASRKNTFLSRETTTIGLVLGAALWVGLVVYNIETLVDVYRHARTGLNSTAMGYRYHQVLAAFFSLVVLGIPAAALGSVLPLWIRVVADHADFLGERVGRLLTWNTLGAVVGVLLTGFVLMPQLGLRGSFAALGLLLAAAALIIAWVTSRRTALVFAGSAAALLVFMAVTGGQSWRLVLSSGVFRWRETEVSANAMKMRLDKVKLLYYRDAADATVSVEELQVDGERQVSLRVNGKPDASSHGDLSTQVLLAHLPLMAHPESEDVFVFGLGSGITAGSVLQHPVKRLTIAENCQPVVDAAEFFKPWNNNVMADARTVICPEDARTVLKLGRQHFDVIIAEPSNPWTAGVGSVFSREFYQIASRKLKPGGVMAQWFHVYEMNDQIVQMVIRTFSSVFPHIEIWDTNGGDIIMLGSLEPWRSDLATAQRIFGLPGVRRELEAVGLVSPEALFARQFASQRTGFAVAGPGPLQSDEFPVLEYAAPKAFFIGQRADGMKLFDERTWQVALAPGEKQQALASLSADTLKRLFAVHVSVNPDLRTYMGLDVANPSVAQERSGGGAAVPIAFRAAMPSKLVAPLNASTNDVVRRLFAAEQVLRGETGDPAAAVSEIQGILDSLKNDPSYNPGFSVTYYTLLAVHSSLRVGDAAAARKALLRGLELQPASGNLQYLSRVLLRQGVLKGDEPQVAGD
jgi:predicted membrane-bound spermidine synthase